MKKIIFILTAFLVLSTCSEYQKALKSENIGKKFTLGEELFNAGKYSKANKLFAQIVPNYRGKPEAEKLMFLYSMSFYKMEDYITAGYQFDRFATSYPTSEKAEEAAFLSAKSYYLLSPVYSKDQTETKEAIDRLQLFINTYPESDYLAEASVYTQELDFKLEKKAFEIAKQYDLITDYKASIKSFNNFLLDFPGSTLREEALYYRMDAAYKLALKSIELLKQERIETAISYYNTFKKKYPDSKFTPQITEIFEDLQKELNTITDKT